MARRPIDDMPLGPSKVDLEQLVRFYTLREIGSRYGVCGDTVWKWCRAFGIRPPRAKFFPLAG